MTATVDISPREAQVLELLGEHLSNAEIAARLFISVRTVESHVSSLLRKLEVPDRRALAGRAAASRPAAPGATPAAHPAPVLPAPPTSFVGRASERAELAGLIGAHRQVTAAGPGGVGKTRLALAVAADAAEAFPDGVWFVDLVPVTDPGMVAAAVAGALGVAEQPGRGMTESVVAALADRRTLLVLDNCEQVRDGVAPFLERLLAACPRVTVLATSRARLMVPFERVYPVPPLALSGDGEPDAVVLFTERATAVGHPLDPALRDRVVEICARLDGMALAIELAAARYPTLGVDGLTAALAHPLRMLTGGSRADDRHRSVRAALDWSHTLLEPDDRALLRRVSVFVAPFTVPAAAEVAGVDEGVAMDGLARLAEQSLLAVKASARGTGYRAAETIRQYGTERLIEAGELADVRSRHLRRCLAEAAALAVPGADWRARFDAVADDLRAALAWAADEPEHRADAHRLARHLAESAFARNLVGESQRRYEQAAALAADPAAAAPMLRHAAAVAGCRTLGDDMYRLHRAAADAARRAGDAGRAAADLATAATVAYRFAGTFVEVPPPDETTALVDEARGAAEADPAARAAVALADAARRTDALAAARTPDDDAVREAVAGAERAVELARGTGDPLAESAALDALTAVQSWVGDTFATAATARRRSTLLASAPDTPAAVHELVQALGEVAQTCLAVGDLPDARRWARRLADHPSMAEVGHRATCWLLVADALAGDAAGVLAGGVRFLDGWRRGGGAAQPDLDPAVAAVAMVHDLRGDHDARREWGEVLDAFGTSPHRVHGYGAVFDAMLLLHHGRAAEALERLAPEPEEVRRWITWIWDHWYVALRAEATVLAGASDARDRLAAARTRTSGDPLAGAIVERAAALLDGDGERLLATAAAFDAAGCGYQSARTRVLAGGEHAERGAAAIAELGLVPMAARWPDGTGRGSAG
ncbi:ATP-binding protein [Actinomadura algeriensis]|uniref:ATPase/DNA-binding CsgD family transcriptional regulator n=1 Tax=Actinomadura algeriensis TaxID=1679523 RepID=A0ABR9JNF5_9ACTN|nr:LuxR C-terminal-related transcriptional regulator [Actinomadura algeriensis]MBE1532101.1 putative ATPase/DNA-binding CsgD family transcriptional regulator [Actinomadura algeriensis]